MQTLYIGPDYKLHTENAEGRHPVETDIFDGFCAAYIEGHIFVPEGMTHKKTNGATIRGPFVQPWESDEVLTAYQQQYEATRAELAAAYREGVNSV